jgi:DNA-binding GntR family transcriptional regulator
MMANGSHFNLKSLREQVYDYLRTQMNEGRLKPGAFLNLNEISKELGMSRTPLRDALFQLECEGFVTIFPRRGVVVNPLTLETIKHIYEILGALESAVIINVSLRLRKEDADMMEKYNEQMRKALERDNFSAFYEANLKFHNVYLDLSDNAEMLHYIKIHKERLYDFPRNKAFVKQWEVHSLDEHSELIELMRKPDFNAAADYMRDVHWSFSVQERFIRKYYFANRAELDVSKEDSE